MVLTQTFAYFYNTLFFLSFFLFIWGLVGLMLYQKTLILVLMALELALLGLGFIFLLYGLMTNTIFGEIILFILLTLGGTESALGLSLIMLYYSFKNSIDLQVITDLKI